MIESVSAVVGLILSAFFSGSEITFVQANPVQIEVWKKQGRKRAQETYRYLVQPERFLTTVLIGTNLANIITSSFATVALLNQGVSGLWSVLIIALVILMFGEIIPKVLFREHANTLALGLTPFLRFAELLLTPFVGLVKFYARIISPGHEAPSSRLLTREDLKVLFEEAEISDEFERDEKEVISKIFDFGSRPVRTAMTVRSDVVAVPRGSSIPDVIQVLLDTGLSKIPVYGGNLDTIVGIVFLHDLFRRPESVESILKRPLILPETIPANEALQVLKRHNSSIAIVSDKDGKTVGLVTVEDLVEELFGEFEDVFDIEGRQVTRVPDGSLVVDSLVEIEDLAKRYGFQIPEGEYETIGGFLLSTLGRIPRSGEMLEFDTFRIKILRATPSRLRRLHLVKKP
ncbi:MAG: hemolysin family protein [Fidelibacterota bacterium]